MTLVNPEIVWRSGERATAEEGCLSLPGQFADVTRPQAVKVRYSRPSTGGARCSTRTACSPAASSMSSTISTASCSSTICGAQAQHDHAQADQDPADACLTACAWWSWARPHSRCRAWRRCSRPATRSPPSTPAAAPRRPRPPAAPHARARGGRPAGAGSAYAAHAASDAVAQAEFAALERRPRRGGRLRAAAAAPGPRGTPPGLHQPARLAAAALARCRADRARDPGRRPAETGISIFRWRRGSTPGRSTRAVAADRRRRPRPSCTSGSADWRPR